MLYEELRVRLRRKTTYCNTSEGTSGHIRAEREVGR
jgi:hypothetical protein